MSNMAAQREFNFAAAEPRVFVREYVQRRPCGLTRIRAHTRRRPRRRK